MRKSFRLFVILFAFGLSQAWAFEGFHELWKSEKPVNENVEKLKKERASQLTELQKIEPIYLFVVDEVKSLLPNLIGAIEGKGAGEKITEDDIAQLCNDIKKQLLVPSSCTRYLKSVAAKDKEELINSMEDRQATLKNISPRYRAIKKRLMTLEEEINNVESAQ